MIQPTTLRAVLRCGGCGDVLRRDFHLFNLSGGHPLSLRCDCGQDVIRLQRQRPRAVVVAAACTVCLRPHPVTLATRRLLRGPVSCLICPGTDVELGFLGPPAAVTARAEPWAQELARAGAYARMETYPVSRGTMTDLLGFLHHLTRDGKLSSLHEHRSADLWDADS